LAGRPEGKRKLGKPTRRGIIDIKIVLQYVGWRDTDWLDLAHDGEM